jgi:hypothetical protein
MTLAADPGALGTAVAGLGLGMFIMVFLGWALAMLFGLIWLAVPFAIFGLKGRLDRIAKELEALRLTLVPAVQRPRREQSAHRGAVAPIAAGPEEDTVSAGRHS